MARSQPDHRRDARSHSTERVASARRLVRDCVATAPALPGRQRCPDANTVPERMQDRTEYAWLRSSPLPGIGVLASSQLTAASERRGAGLRSDRLPRRRSGLAAADPALDAAPVLIPAATRRTCVKRSIETTRTSCSTRSTPRARTTHMTPRAPLRAHLRRRRDKPRRLLAHPSEMAPVVRSGLRLDRDRNPGRRDRHRVDVSPALPRQRVPKPPPLRLERGERALHLVLRVGADSTATSERKPVPSVETQTRRRRGAAARRAPPRPRSRSPARAARR